MDHKRWVELMESDTLKLTEEELALGWHFCWDWDGLLISPDMNGGGEWGDDPAKCRCGVTLQEMRDGPKSSD